MKSKMEDARRDEYVETATGNKISRSSVLCGTQNIRIQGRSTVETGAVLRGDLAAVKLGKYCLVSSRCVLRPACKIVKHEAMVHFPMVVGDHVFIGEGSVVEATVIGSKVVVGRNCVIGKRCVVKDCVWIKDGTVLAPDTVVAPFSVYEGLPGKLVEELPPSAPDMIQNFIISRLHSD